jgi:hypothetical protein
MLIRRRLVKFEMLAAVLCLTPAAAFAQLSDDQDKPVDEDSAPSASFPIRSSDGDVKFSAFERGCFGPTTEKAMWPGLRPLLASFRL